MYIRYKQREREVRAAFMTLRAYNISKGQPTSSKQDPNARGYHVLVDGGYDFWVPEQHFLAAHEALEIPPTQTTQPDGIDTFRAMGDK